MTKMAIPVFWPNLFHNVAMDLAQNLVEVTSIESIVTHAL